MKKNISIMLIMIMSITMLAGCGQKEKEVVMEFSTFQTLRNFGEVNDETIENLKKEEGVIDAKKKEDGSVTITMEPEAHKKLVENMDEELKEIIEFTKTSSEFLFIKDVKLSDDYSKLDIVVDKGELEIYKTKNKEQGGEDILKALSFSLGSIISTYKGYNGMGEDVEIKYIDDSSDEEIEKFMFPEFFEAMLEEGNQEAEEEEKEEVDETDELDEGNKTDEKEENKEE